MAVTCWSYMAVRKLISLNRNASNFPRAIILCPQQNKRVIFLKMRGIEIFDKSYGKCCTFDCGNCSFHKHLACLIWECGPGAGERGLKAKNCYFSLKGRICFKKALWVGGFTLSVHCAIKGKLQGSCFELYLQQASGLKEATVAQTGPSQRMNTCATPRSQTACYKMY